MTFLVPTDQFLQGYKRNDVSLLIGLQESIRRAAKVVD